MADKGFGVKEIDLIGASGTPTIESPNNLNLNASNVTVSTDITIGGKIGLGGPNYGSAGQVLTSNGSGSDPTWQNNPGTGKVLQLIRVVHTSQANTNSGSTAWVSTGLQASITPSSANSKILVSFEHSIYHALTSVTETSSLHAIRIKRGSTVVYNPPANAGGSYEFGLTDTDTTKATVYYNRSRVEYLDSPSTTSSITYSTDLAAYNGSGIVYSNYQDSSTTTTPQSWMTLMEISA